MPGARLTSLKIMPEDMLDTSSPLRAEMEFTADGMIATGSGKAVVSLPWVGKNFGIVNFILGGTGLEKRKYPLKTEVACGLQENVAIKLGEDFTGAVSMPVCSPVNDPFHELSGTRGIQRSFAGRVAGIETQDRGVFA